MRAAFFESCTRSAGYSFIYGSKSTGAIRNFVGSICADNTLHMAYTKNISDKSAESAAEFCGQPWPNYHRERLHSFTCQQAFDVMSEWRVSSVLVL